MKLLSILSLLSCFFFAGFSQEKGNLEKLQEFEMQLQAVSFNIVNGETELDRANACFEFIPKLVEALKTKGSFEYPFDSLHTVSIVYPEDRAFRIFTWQLSWDKGAYRFYGAIQMNNESELKLFPLFDYSDSLTTPQKEILNPEKWYGALYYNVTQFKKKGKKYYALFGWDGHDLWSARKLVEILHFEEEKPVFGAPVFNFPEDNEKVLTRFIIEYRKNVVVRLNYSPSEKMIVFDHLVPTEENAEDLAFTYIPDGTYEGFKLKKGVWNYVEKVFHFSIDEFDNPPVPKPIKKN